MAFQNYRLVNVMQFFHATLNKRLKLHFHGESEIQYLNDFILMYRRAILITFILIYANSMQGTLTTVSSTIGILIPLQYPYKSVIVERKNRYTL